MNSNNSSLSKNCDVSDEIVSDCWNDVDETEFACKEKERIMMKLKPPRYENSIDTDRLFPKSRRGTIHLWYGMGDSIENNLVFVSR